MLPLQDTKKSKKLPFWVLTIVGANALVFFMQLTTQNPDAFIAQFALIPVDVSSADLSTLLPFFSSQFLHGGLLHVATNMWFLWVFGGNLEEKLGVILFPIVYLVSGLLGNLLEYVTIASSPIPLVGASGAVAGILGAYFAFFPTRKIKTLIIIIFFVTILDLPATVLLFYWFILQIFSSFVTTITASADLGGIAYFAHIGGFLSGWILGKIYQMVSLKRETHLPIPQ